MYTKYNTIDKLFWSIIVLLHIVLVSSCSKLIEVEPPITQLETKQIFQNDQSAIAAVTGLYRQMLLTSSTVTNGGLTRFCGLSADELINTTSPDPDDEFRMNNIQVRNGSISGSLWQMAYKNIYHTNAILEGLETAGISETLKRQLKGEALVVRSLNYFYLINLFGDVPLVLTTDFRQNQSMPRTSMADVYVQVTSDLLEAKGLLMAAYPSSGRVRPNKFTATALLARVYLYRKDWMNAEKQASEIINSGMYALPAELNNCFLSNSTETIWSLIQDRSNTSEGQMFIPAFSFLKPPFIVTDTLYRSFESNDLRKSKWLASTLINGVAAYYPLKYKKGADFSSTPPVPTEYYVVFRLAEQYLIRAEANAQLGNIAASKADLNFIRQRAGLNGTTANNKDDLLLGIEKERQLELFAEWGHRWFDLKRSDRVNNVLAGLKTTNWQTTDVLYPIPFDQILLNPSLAQNAGY